MRIMRKLPLLAPLALIASPAAAAEEDFQAWSALNATTDAGKRVVLSLDAQMRFSEDASRLGQAVIRPGVGYRLGPNTTATLGYAYVYSDPVGPARTREHRVWQQLAFRLAGDGKGVTVVGRTRLEQRWFEGSQEMGWRLRQQLRLTAPLAGKVRALAWSEAFVTFDDTDWGQRSGLDRWRNAVGLVVPVNRSLTLEPAYINQYVVRPGTDRVHHIAGITAAARF